MTHRTEKNAKTQRRKGAKKNKYKGMGGQEGIRGWGPGFVRPILSPYLLHLPIPLLTLLASLRLCVHLFVAVGAAILLGIPSVSAQEGEQQVPYVFESRVDMVSVAVAVTDDEGNFIADLEIEDFTVLEDGVRQDIRLFAAGLKESWVGLPPEMKDELSGRQVVGLLLDASGSMEEDIRLVREAV